MSRYFDNFRLIRYNNSLSINITQRAAILDSVFGDNYAFYPYQVKNGMRAEQVAEKYYGDPDLVWLVYFSNNIVDPYHDWAMDEETFNTHLIKKYGSVQSAHQTIVKYRINWYEDTRELTKIQYDSLPWYEKKYWTPEFDMNNLPLQYVRKPMDFIANFQDSDGTVTLSVDSEESEYWVAVTAYDVENEENTKKAHIRLLDSRLASTAQTNLRSLLGE
jgi:hypothetical protein